MSYCWHLLSINLFLQLWCVNRLQIESRKSQPWIMSLEKSLNLGGPHFHHCQKEQTLPFSKYEKWDFCVPVNTTHRIKVLCNACLKHHLRFCIWNCSSVEEYLAWEDLWDIRFDSWHHPNQKNNNKIYNKWTSLIQRRSKTTPFSWSMKRWHDNKQTKGCGSMVESLLTMVETWPQYPALEQTKAEEKKEGDKEIKGWNEGRN